MKIVQILIKKRGPPVNSEVMVDLKIIESPASIVKLHMYNWFQLKFCQKISSSNIICSLKLLFEVFLSWN